MLCEALDKFPGNRVLVIGDVCWDYHMAAMPRRNIEGREAFVVREKYRRPGMALAVEAMVQALGGMPLLDYHGEPGEIWRVGNKFAVEFPSRIQPNENILANVARKAIPEVRAVIVSDYCKGAVTELVCRTVMETAAENGVPVLVDPGRGVPWKRYAMASVIKCNHEEYYSASRDGFMGDVIVTHGQHGMVRMLDGEVMAEHPTIPAVGDACGCGDMVAAVLGLCLASGVSLDDGCRIANVAARMKLAHQGTTPIQLDALRLEVYVAETKPLHRQ